jgi:hypothetical protein
MIKTWAAIFAVLGTACSWCLLTCGRWLLTQQRDALFYVSTSSLVMVLALRRVAL